MVVQVTAVKVAAVAASLTLVAAGVLIGGLALMITAQERKVALMAGDDDA